MKNTFDDDKKSERSQAVIAVALVFLIGLLFGLGFHDTFTQHPVDRSDISSWYPR